MTTKFKKGVIYFPVCGAHDAGFYLLSHEMPETMFGFPVYQCVDCKMFFIREPAGKSSDSTANFDDAVPRMRSAREFGKTIDYVLCAILAALTGVAAIHVVFPEVFK